MNTTGLRWIYALSDLAMSFVGVILFDIMRYFSLPPGYEVRSLGVWLFHDTSILWGLVAFPLMMLSFYALSGYYNDVRSKSRLDDLRNTFTAGFAGMLVIYFIILINDYLPERIRNYEMLGLLWVSLTFPVLLGRLIITYACRRNAKRRGGIYTAVIVGTPERAKILKDRLKGRRQRPASVPRFKIIEDISPDRSLSDMIDAIGRTKPDAILMAPHPEGIQATTDLIASLYPVGTAIFITPDLYQLLTSRTRVTDVAGEPLIDITNSRLSPATTNIKRLSDIVGSSLALAVLSPVFAAIALAVKIDSKGPVFYKQERIGYHKHPFRIIKFRTMTPEAEPDGPALSMHNDPRITRVGHFLRKYRLDELPQFWNVLRGEMSLVGPRPERRFFIDKIVERVPHYSLIHQVRPGITSWGMVKYGYAKNVDEMVERLYYDLLYIENVSFGVDMKIIFHTLATVLSGRGI